MKLRLAAVLRRDGAERETIDVEDVPGRQRVPGLDDLVARGQNRDARAREDFDLRVADRCDRANPAGEENVAGRYDGLPGLDVGAALADVLSSGDGAQNTDRVSGSPRFFHHDDGVGTRGSGAPVAISTQPPRPTV